MPTKLSPRPKLSTAAARTLVYLAAERVKAQQRVAAIPAPTDAEMEKALRECADFPRGFRAFLPHWQFVNRETGAIHTFANLWPGQEEVADRFVEHSWWFLLKAGKLGFTEIECAWDGYVAAFGPPNSRIHLFSKELEAAKALLEWVKFGLRRLPPEFGVRILGGEPGGDTVRSLRLRVDRPGVQLHDVRTIYAYATALNMAIDQSAVHAHIDEWAHMDHPKEIWATVQTTISPIGSCHIVTRGAGEDEFVSSLWTSAAEGSGRMRGYFAAWNMRPDRDADWRRMEAAQQTAAGMAHFAPETPDDAFLGDEDNNYIELEWWDACYDKKLATDYALVPGDKTPLILAADAGTSGDNFAVTAHSRHPERHDEPAVRAVKVWKPDQFPDKRIHYDAVENWLRVICQGGCIRGHSQAPGFKREDCEDCQNANLMPGFNVAELAYDPYQLEDMMQRLRRERIVFAREFPQGNDRYESDRMLRNLVINRQMWHNGDENLREAVGNAKAKLQQGQESKMRIEKKAPHRKVDAAVAAAMGTYRCMKLNL